MGFKRDIEFIKSEIERIGDTRLIEEIKHVILSFDPEKIEKEFLPMTEKELLERNRKSRMSIESNELISQSEVKDWFEKK